MNEVASYSLKIWFAKKSFCAHIGKSESDGQNNASVAAQANDWPGTMFGENEKVCQRV